MGAPEPAHGYFHVHRNTIAELVTEGGVRMLLVWFGVGFNSDYLAIGFRVDRV